MKKYKAMSWDRKWNILFETEEWGLFPNEALIREVSKYYKRKGNKQLTALELGCGGGANRMLYEIYCEKFVGIDASDIAIQKFKEKMVRNKSNLNSSLLCEDLYKYDIKDLNCEFDIVVDVECLYCIKQERAKKIVDDSERLLKKGGIFISIMFSNNTNREVLRDVRGVELRSHSDIKSLFSRFEEVKIEKISRTTGNMTKMIEEYVIVAGKSI